MVYTWGGITRHVLVKIFEVYVAFSKEVIHEELRAAGISGFSKFSGD